MVSFPICKINLGLNVIEKRGDGFHNIETCFYPLQLTDILEAIPSKQLEFNSTGITIPGSVGTNLCLRAYQMIKYDHAIDPMSIHLHKVIPMGAGLGGGSSDGAFMLKLINDIFSLALTVEELQRYAQQLGSDCAFFLHGKPMFGSGRGEILTPANVGLKGKFIVLVKPDIHVATAEAFAGIKPHAPYKSVQETLQRTAITEWKNLLVNDFEISVFEKYPRIKMIKDTLYSNGALYASMSGSGSSVFGLFESPVDLCHLFADCFYWSGVAEY